MTFDDYWKTAFGAQGVDERWRPLIEKAWTDAQVYSETIQAYARDFERVVRENEQLRTSRDKAHSDNSYLRAQLAERAEHAAAANDTQKMTAAERAEHEFLRKSWELKPKERACGVVPGGVRVDLGIGAEEVRLHSAFALNETNPYIRGYMCRIAAALGIPVADNANASWNDLIAVAESHNVYVTQMAKDLGIDVKATSARCYNAANALTRVIASAKGDAALRVKVARVLSTALRYPQEGSGTMCTTDELQAGLAAGAEQLVDSAAMTIEQAHARIAALVQKVEGKELANKNLCQERDAFSRYVIESLRPIIPNAPDSAFVSVAAVLDFVAHYVTVLRAAAQPFVDYAEIVDPNTHPTNPMGDCCRPLPHLVNPKYPDHSAKPLPTIGDCWALRSAVLYRHTAIDQTRGAFDETVVPRLFRFNMCEMNPARDTYDHVFAIRTFVSGFAEALHAIGCIADAEKVRSRVNFDKDWAPPAAWQWYC